MTVSDRMAVRGRSKVFGSVLGWHQNARNIDIRAIITSSERPRAPREKRMRVRQSDDLQV